MSGNIAVKFHPEAMEKLCLKYINNFEPSRYVIIAIRIFAAKEFIVTVFAEDKLNHSTLKEGKLAVKKFKIENVNPAELPALAEGFNFTICPEGYDLAGMEIINR